MTRTLTNIPRCAFTLIPINAMGSSNVMITFYKKCNVGLQWNDSIENCDEPSFDSPCSSSSNKGQHEM